jgi:predicted nucleotidyltransferase
MRTGSTGSLTEKARDVSTRDIRAVCSQIVARFSPRKVILFGSRARGDAAEGSDVDLLVIADGRPRPDESLRIRRSIRYDFPLDILVIGADRLSRRLAAGDFFLRDAVENGKVLYERADG